MYEGHIDISRVSKLVICLLNSSAFSQHIFSKKIKLSISTNPHSTGLPLTVSNT